MTLVSTGDLWIKGQSTGSNYGPNRSLAFEFYGDYSPRSLQHYIDNQNGTDGHDSLRDFYGYIHFYGEGYADTLILAFSITLVIPGETGSPFDITTSSMAQYLSAFTGQRSATLTGDAINNKVTWHRRSKHLSGTGGFVLHTTYDPYTGQSYSMDNGTYDYLVRIEAP